MKSIMSLVFSGLFLVAAEFAVAASCEQDNNKLTRLLGLDGPDGTVYVNVESASNECSCSYFRFRPVNTDTHMALSILLSAKMASKEVRIDLLESGNCDSAYRVYIE